MDDTAQIKPVTPQTSGAQAQLMPASDDTTQTSTVSVVPPTQDQSYAQQVIGRHPEHAPVAASAPVAEAPLSGPDTVSDASDVADSQQAPDVVIKESHPAVEVPQELKEAGVEQGMDAKQDRPEEQQQVHVTLPKVSAPSMDLPVVEAQPLPMDYQQAIVTQKSSKIRDSVKWLATLIKYQWEKLQAKGENA